MARKMKDSGIEWIGEIPEGWETCLYKYCCSVQPGYPFDSAKFSNSSTDGFPLIRIRDITSGEIQTYYTGEYPPNYIVTAGDLLVGMDGDFNVRWWNNDAALLNQRCCRVTEKDSVLRRFLYYVLPFTLQRINTLTYATTVKHLANGDILNSFIAFPSLPAQQNIVHYLDTVCSEIDAMLSKTRSSIEEYKKLKQAVITQAVTKGVRGEREMKDSGVEWIGEIPKEWVCEKIKYATSISRGLFNHRPRNDERYYNGKYPFIQTGDVANATKYIVSYSQTLNELGKSVSKEFPKGTLTMTIAANVGDVAILNFDAYFPDSVVGFIPNKNIRTLYLFYVFSAMKDEFTRTAIKSTQLNLNIDRVKETFIPVTLNVNEQCEIENYLESKCAEIDGLIAKKEQLVKELESYKKSLIYEVVTGKREV